MLFRILPRSSIYKLEYGLRYVYSWLYAGKKVRCNLCRRYFSRFIRMGEHDRLCPRCGSRARHRRLWTVLQDMHKEDPYMEVLHFSPSRIVSRRMRQLSGPRYHTSALESDAMADHHYDMTSIGAASHAYDLIICYHILEHIERDREAMSELFRILSPRGSLLVQTPMKPGKTYENAAVRAPEERKVHFGQEDHVRIYSASGLTRRLTDAGFTVHPVTYPPDPCLGMLESETVFFCKKDHDDRNGDHDVKNEDHDVGNGP